MNINLDNIIQDILKKRITELLTIIHNNYKTQFTRDDIQTELNIILANTLATPKHDQLSKPNADEAYDRSDDSWLVVREHISAVLASSRIAGRGRPRQYPLSDRLRRPSATRLNGALFQAEYAAANVQSERISAP